MRYRLCDTDYSIVGHKHGCDPYSVTDTSEPMIFRDSLVILQLSIFSSRKLFIAHMCINPSIVIRLQQSRERNRNRIDPSRANPWSVIGHAPISRDRRYRIEPMLAIPWSVICPHPSRLSDCRFLNPHTRSIPWSVTVHLLMSSIRSCSRPHILPNP